MKKTLTLTLETEGKNKSRSVERTMRGGVEGQFRNGALWKFGHVGERSESEVRQSFVTVTRRSSCF